MLLSCISFACIWYYRCSSARLTVCSKSVLVLPHKPVDKTVQFKFSMLKIVEDGHTHYWWHSHGYCCGAKTAYEVLYGTNVGGGILTLIGSVILLVSICVRPPFVCLYNFHTGIFDILGVCVRVPHGFGVNSARRASDSRHVVCSLPQASCKLLALRTRLLAMLRMK